MPIWRSDLDQRVGHLAFQHQSAVEDDLAPHDRLHIITGRFVEVRVDAGTHDLGHGDMLGSHVADDIANHSHRRDRRDFSA